MNHREAEELQASLEKMMQRVNSAGQKIIDSSLPATRVDEFVAASELLREATTNISLILENYD